VSPHFDDSDTVDFKEVVLMRAFRLLRQAGLVVVAAVALTTGAFAQDGGSPLSLMAGSWTGAGTITLSDGNRERLRCRSNYQPDASGTTMRLTLSCASDSYKFDLNSNVQYSNGQISGNWNELSRNAAGNITGTARGGTVDVRAEGQTFAAFININTRNDKQNVSIRAPGSTMQEVAIQMSRR
jgi:hypothetical protein